MKRITVMLLLATVGGCRMADEGPDIPIARPASASRTSGGALASYHGTSWNEGDDAGDAKDGKPKPRVTAAASRARTTQMGDDCPDCSYAAQKMARSNRRNGDDPGLNDPATQTLIQATMTRSSSSSQVRRPTGMAVAQADRYGPSSRTQDYPQSQRPRALPDEVRTAMPLERSSARPAPGYSSDLMQTGGQLRVAGRATSGSPAARTTGGRLSLVNSRRIRLRYAADRVMAAGGSPVEVWGTRDMRTWKRYPLLSDSGVQAADGRADTRPSCLVEAEGEGVYGFSLCSTHGPSAGRGPQPGDTPQMWVAVDLTRPTVRLIRGELDEHGSTRKVVIHWTAQDANMGDRPITLCYSLKPGGPWTSIASNVANSGRYEWTLPARIGTFVHLRVQARDLMGNVGIGEGAHPVYVSQHEESEPASEGSESHTLLPKPSRSVPVTQAKAITGEESGPVMLEAATEDDR